MIDDVNKRIIDKSRELKALLSASKDVQSNPVKRLAWATTLQDIIDYLEGDD